MMMGTIRVQTVIYGNHVTFCHISGTFEMALMWLEVCHCVFYAAAFSASAVVAANV